MTDDLVTRLREHIEHKTGCGFGYWETPSVCTEAAARIRELEAAVEFAEAELTSLRAAAEGLAEALRHEIDRSRRHLAASTIAALAAWPAPT